MLCALAGFIRCHRDDGSGVTGLGKDPHGREMPTSPQRLRGHDPHVVSTGDRHLDLYEGGVCQELLLPRPHGGDLSSTSWGGNAHRVGRILL